MKKLLLSLAIAVANFSFAQITLEHSFPENFNVCNYSDGNDIIYITYKSDGNQLNIYNVDYTLRKTVNIPLPANYNNIWLGQNGDYPGEYNISKHIFNTDDKYEFMITASFYDEVNQKTYRKLLLINEDGQLIKDFHPNAGTVGYYEFFFVYHEPVTNTNKLRVENLVPGSNYKSQSDVYALPTSELTTKEIESQKRLSAFPVPTNKTLTIFNPGNGVNKVEVYDVSGKVVVSKSFNMNENRISIDVENLPKGNYVYKIGNVSSKFIKN